MTQDGPETCTASTSLLTTGSSLAVVSGFSAMEKRIWLAWAWVLGWLTLTRPSPRHRMSFAPVYAMMRVLKSSVSTN